MGIRETLDRRKVMVGLGCAGAGAVGCVTGLLLAWAGATVVGAVAFDIGVVAVIGGLVLGLVGVIGTRLAGLLLTVAGASMVAAALALYWANSGYYGAGEDWTGSVFLGVTTSLALLVGIPLVIVGIDTTLVALGGCSAAA